MSIAGAALLFNPLHSFMDKQPGMMHRKIPVSGEQLPVVGLGSWLQFDVGTDEKERQQLMLVLKNMKEKGGRLIDSSPMYGEAEKVIGELSAKSGFPDDFFYATKVWTNGKQAGIDQMNASIKKLKRKRLDLMQVHNLVDWKTHLDSMNELKKEGKIRYTGITHYTSSAYGQMEEIVRKKWVDFVQFNYSIRVRNAEKSLLSAAKDSGVAVIINEPFESGRLFAQVKGKSLPPWAGDYSINSWGQFFLKFILSNDAVNCVIPGTSNPVHVIDNMGAGYGTMPDAAGRKKMIAYLESV